MPSKSPFQIDIPLTDVLSYVFPPNTQPSDRPIWIDAEDTSRSLSPKQLLGWVKRLGVGLDRLGIKQNEAVMMYSSNHIFIPVAYLGVAGSGRVFSGCNPAYGVNGMHFWRPKKSGWSLLEGQKPYFRFRTRAQNSSSSTLPSLTLYSRPPTRSSSLETESFSLMIGHARRRMVYKIGRQCWEANKKRQVINGGA